MMSLGHEDEQREFKRTTSEMKEGVASIAAILNKHGSGELYFGVKKDGVICGQDVSESTLREISQAIGNSIRPAIYPEIIHEKTPEGRSYVRISFSGEDVPYACNGKYRIRVADEDVLMSPEELRLRFRDSESRRNPWDGRLSNKTIDDIDERTLRGFVERGRDKDRVKFEYTTAREVLDHLGLVEGGRLLNAGVALFCPSKTTDLKMAMFGTHARTDILDLRHEEGLLFDLVRIGESFVISNTRSRVDTSVPGASDVIPEIPKKALHEALMNAYAHRDWEDRTAVMVEIFNDAVEIISPGWFIEGQSPEEHLSGQSTSPKTRNELIARTLYKSGDIESQGTGIKRIKEFCDEAGIDVEYVRTPDGTKLIFHRNDAFGKSLIIEASRDKVSGDSLSDSLSDSLNLSDRDRSVLEIVVDNPKITAAQISQLLGMSESTINRALKKLQEVKVLSRSGSKKTGIWVVQQGSSSDESGGR